VSSWAAVDWSALAASTLACRSSRPATVRRCFKVFQHFHALQEGSLVPAKLVALVIVPYPCLNNVRRIIEFHWNRRLSQDIEVVAGVAAGSKMSASLTVGSNRRAMRGNSVANWLNSCERMTSIWRFSNFRAERAKVSRAEKMRACGADVSVLSSRRWLLTQYDSEQRGFIESRAANLLNPLYSVRLVQSALYSDKIGAPAWASSALLWEMGSFVSTAPA